MKRKFISLNPSQGGGSNITAQEFFKRKIADATVFLDHFEPLTPNMKVKYNNFWELLRNGNRINNILMKRTDKDGLDYVWIQIDLGRGGNEFKTILLSNEMFDFLVQYQKAQVTVRFTLQELLDEAQRIEGANPQSGGQSSATV